LAWQSNPKFWTVSPLKHWPRWAGFNYDTGLPRERIKELRRTPEMIKQVVHMTLHEKPANATHWSLRTMAAAAGISLHIAAGCVRARQRLALPGP
jgi:hypothetical protein